MTQSAGVIALSPWQIGLAVLLIGLVVAVSARQALGLERDLLVGALRAVVQLYVVGLILGAVFASAQWYWVLLMLAVMTAVATQAAVSRLKQPIPGGPQHRGPRPSLVRPAVCHPAGRHDPR